MALFEWPPPWNSMVPKASVGLSWVCLLIDHFSDWRSLRVSRLSFFSFWITEILGVSPTCWPIRRPQQHLWGIKQKLFLGLSRVEVRFFLFHCKVCCITFWHLGYDHKVNEWLVLEWPKQEYSQKKHSRASICSTPWVAQHWQQPSTQWLFGSTAHSGFGLLFQPSPLCRSSSGLLCPQKDNLRGRF